MGTRISSKSFCASCGRYYRGGSCSFEGASLHDKFTLKRLNLCGYCFNKHKYHIKRGLLL